MLSEEKFVLLVSWQGYCENFYVIWMHVVTVVTWSCMYSVDWLSGEYHFGVPATRSLVWVMWSHQMRVLPLWGYCHKPVTLIIPFVDFLSIVYLIFPFWKPLWKSKCPEVAWPVWKGQWCPVIKSLGRTCGCPVGQKALGHDKEISVAREWVNLEFWSVNESHYRSRCTSSLQRWSEDHEGDSSRIS